jgi:3-mercaptopyruvate sulfurtransferase SseA
VAQELMQQYGFSNVQALQGGWKGWEKAGYPTEPK